MCLRVFHPEYKTMLSVVGRRTVSFINCFAYTQCFRTSSLDDLKQLAGNFHGSSMTHLQSSLITPGLASIEFTFRYRSCFIILATIRNGVRQGGAKTEQKSRELQAMGQATTHQTNRMQGILNKRSMLDDALRWSNRSLSSSALQNGGRLVISESLSQYN